MHKLKLEMFFFFGSLCKRRVSRNVNKMRGDKKTNKTPMEIINMDRKTELKRLL